MKNIFGILGDHLDILEASVGNQREVTEDLNELAFRRYWKTEESLGFCVSTENHNLQ